MPRTETITLAHTVEILMALPQAGVYTASVKVTASGQPMMSPGRMYAVICNFNTQKYLIGNQVIGDMDKAKTATPIDLREKICMDLCDLFDAGAFGSM